MLKIIQEGIPTWALGGNLDGVPGLITEENTGRIPGEIFEVSPGGAGNVIPGGVLEETPG